MESTDVIVVRHGQTQWNTERRFQGHHDSPLTQKGISQAEALARRLAKERLSALYSSDLGRARQTAELIAERMIALMEAMHGGRWKRAEAPNESGFRVLQLAVRNP